jgi:small subunit ribosomal protein S1
VSDVVREGQEVEVLVLSVDPNAQRIALSLKALTAEPVEEKKRQDAEEEEPPETGAKKAASKKPAGELKGGLDRGSGGEKFGLKW